jgi:hypothetical protein
MVKNSNQKPPAPWTITTGVDVLLDVLTTTMGGRERMGEKKRVIFHVFVFLLNTTISIPNIIFYCVLDANLHVIFWMGQGPASVNLLVPSVLLCVSMSLPLLTLCQLPRKFLKRTLCLVYMIASLAIIGGGGMVLFQAIEVSNDLIYTCGASDLSSKIQTEWKRLWQFRKDCAEKEGNDDILIQQCPGFDKLAKGHDSYVDYIQTMEEDYNCAGFCQFFEKPLFQYEGQTRCASQIGKTVNAIGWTVGLPTLCSGFITIFFGIMFQSYEHI